MASKTNPSSPSTYSYVDFQPYCECKEEEGVETLIVHLPCFKKDQLRVQVSNQGVLRLTGERPLTGDETKTRKSRFRKETNIPQQCDINNIRAKFVNNQLQIIMPKKLPNVQTQAHLQQDQPSSIIGRASKSQDNEKPKVNAMVSDEQGLKASNSDIENGKMFMEVLTSYYGNAKARMFGLGRSLAMLKDGNNVEVGLGIAMFVMVCFGAFMAYKCWSNTSSCSCVEFQA